MIRVVRRIPLNIPKEFITFALTGEPLREQNVAMILKLSWFIFHVQNRLNVYRRWEGRLFIEIPVQHDHHHRQQHLPAK